MRRNLSSKGLTIFWKYLFPGLWIILFGAVAVFFALSDDPEASVPMEMPEQPER